MKNTIKKEIPALCEEASHVCTRDISSVPKIWHSTCNIYSHI